jgi:hypothetical protein
MAMEPEGLGLVVDNDRYDQHKGVSSLIKRKAIPGVDSMRFSHCLLFKVKPVNQLSQQRLLVTSLLVSFRAKPAPHTFEWKSDGLETTHGSALCSVRLVVWVLLYLQDCDTMFAPARIAI